MTACYRLKMNKQWKNIYFGHARINRELDEIAPETRSRSDSIIANMFLIKKTVRYQYPIEQIGLLTMLS